MVNKYVQIQQKFDDYIAQGNITYEACEWIFIGSPKGYPTF